MAPTQFTEWKFTREQLNKFRNKSNFEYCERHGSHMPQEMWPQYFLTPQEERYLAINYEVRLMDFCRKFQPSMPKTVMYTALHYYKRFYINNSVMDYHPKQILVTCVYLATKVEEFNVSISQFVANVRGDGDKATNIILNNELLLMQKLNYHLAIHNPVRPVEGFFIDLKTRFPEVDTYENWRKIIEEKIDSLFLTDAMLVYVPSQIVLACILFASESWNAKPTIEKYIEILFLNPERKNLFKEQCDSIARFLKEKEIPPRDRVKYIESKLEKCRNQDNNPDSEIYKQKLKRSFEENEDDEEMMEIPNKRLRADSS